MIELSELEKFTQCFARLDMESLIVTANLKPSGRIVQYDPIYLDNLLAWCVLGQATGGRMAADLPNDGYWLPIPLKMAWRSELGFPLWDSSVFLPVGEPIADVFYQHKRINHGTRSDTGKVRTVVGRWMERRLPLPVEVCDKWQARCIGNRDMILELLEGVAFLGKRRAIGFGELESWSVESGNFETALVIDGCLAHAIPEQAAKDLAFNLTENPTLVGWTPPQWKPALSSSGWAIGTKLTAEIDWFESASQIG